MADNGALSVRETERHGERESGGMRETVCSKRVKERKRERNKQARGSRRGRGRVD